MCIVSMVMQQWWPPESQNTKPWTWPNTDPAAWPTSIPGIYPLPGDPVPSTPVPVYPAPHSPTYPDPNPVITPAQPIVNPVMPNIIPWPTIQKDPELAAQMLEVLNKLEAIDRKLGLLEQCAVEAKEKQKIKAKLRRIANKGKKKKK